MLFQGLDRITKWNFDTNCALRTSLSTVILRDSSLSHHPKTHNSLRLLGIIKRLTMALPNYRQENMSWIWTFTPSRPREEAQPRPPMHEIMNSLRQEEIRPTRKASFTTMLRTFVANIVASTANRKAILQQETRFLQLPVFSLMNSASGTSDSSRQYRNNANKL